MSGFLINPYRFAAPLLLDLYSGASAAFSLRRLRTAHTSAVVRVRRSSDNTEQDFTAVQVTDGTLTTFCGAGNGFVRTWYDQSGNSKNFSNATTSQQPLLVASGAVNTRSGRPFAVFNNQRLEGSVPLGGQQGMFVVGHLPSRVDASTPGFTLLYQAGNPYHYASFGSWTGTLASERLAWTTGGTGAVYGYGQTYSDITAGTYSWAFLWNGSSASIRQNNTVQSLVTTTDGAFPASNQPVGIQGLGVSPGTSGVIEIAEAIIYASDSVARSAGVLADQMAHFSL